MVKNIIMGFVLLMLAARPAIAENTEEFCRLTKNEPAPFDGFLLSSSALTKIYTKSSEQEARNKLLLKHETEKFNLEIQRNNKLRREERNSAELLYNNMVKLKDNKIEQLNMDLTVSNYLIAGAFLSGGLISGILIYTLTGNH